MLPQVSTKIPWISASFELWHLIVAHSVFELLKNKDRSVSKNQPVYTVSVTWLTQLAEDGTSGGVKRDWNLNSWSHLLANSWLRLDLPHIDFSPSSDRFVTQLSQLLANTLHTWQNPEPAALQRDTAITDRLMLGQIYSTAATQTSTFQTQLT